MPQESAQFLVTGAQGCIGAWVVYRLVEAGHSPVVYDLDPTPRRLQLIATPEEIARVRFVTGDITDGERLERVIADYGVTHIIHLAALQVPACRADPLLGARVNVLGTLHVFEAARRAAGQVQRIVYASSAAVFGPPEIYSVDPVPDAGPLAPNTHYGVFKQCNEGNARVYWLDHGITSIGLRPWTVYGVGRDQGMTSDPTKAIAAALMGQRFHIGFGGYTDMQYVDDVARIFIACATVPFQGAGAFNLRGDVVTVDQVIDAIEAAVPGARLLITHGDQQIPIAPSLDDSGLRSLLGDVPHTPLREGVAQTADRFRRLLAEGRLDASRLGITAKA